MTHTEHRENRWPAQLRYIIGNEACERFSYYGMRSILAAAEVLISTTGLEFAFREAAPEMKSTSMSFWLLTVAVGNLLVAGITKALGGASHSGSVSTSRFLLYAGLTFAVALLFSLQSRFYRYRDAAAARGA